jgi:hypothetical protein
VARPPSTFRQQDVTRAIRAVAAAGIVVARVEVDKSGKIIVITQEGADRGKDTEANEWDRI